MAYLDGVVCGSVRAAVKAAVPSFWKLLKSFREILAGCVKQKERRSRALDLFLRVGDLLEYLIGFAFTRRA
jgi:hypothetical protein